jgi:response regulator of citrate/malate metabolism
MSKSLINAVIIEDDASSVALLNEFLKSFDFIKVIGTAGKYKDSEQLLKEQSSSIDLLILDIDLEGANSLDLIKYLIS